MSLVNQNLEPDHAPPPPPPPPPPLQLPSIQQLRNGLQIKQHGECRRELDDTLALLDQLERDFETLCEQVTALSWNGRHAEYRVTERFRELAERRGVAPWSQDNEREQFLSVDRS